VETLITAETVAAAWHVSPESVYRWAREGKIDRRILGDRTVRFPRSVLDTPRPADPAQE
jgi:predicted site-specific integrase-resolvase